MRPPGGCFDVDGPAMSEAASSQQCWGPPSEPFFSEPESPTHGRPPEEREGGAAAAPPPPPAAIVAEAQDASAQTPSEQTRVRLALNGNSLHPSHSFGFYRGVYWCWRCSGIAGSRPRKLALPCGASHKPAVESGTVNRLKRRLLPCMMKPYGWPLPEGALPHPDVLIQSEHAG